LRLITDTKISNVIQLNVTKFQLNVTKSMQKGG